MRILVVEDEELMAVSLAKGLRKAGFAVDIANDGERGLEVAAQGAYDVMLLDRDLPRVHGDDVVRHLRQSGSALRILMLTAAGGVGDRVGGLRLGADDYLAKPFSMDELLARIHALMRRGEAFHPSVLEVRDLRIDLGATVVRRGGRLISLSPKEFGLVVELVRASGDVVSAEQLLERVWDENSDPFTNAVRVTMVGLRQKLGSPPLIETVRAVGYRITP